MDDVSRAADALFPPEAQQRTENVKFFSGYRREVTSLELAGELLKADRQVQQGIATRVLDIDGDLEA